MAAEADEEIESVTATQLAEELDAGTTVLDIRDVRELWLEGTIPGAKHAPRGMLEFWADPETEYYRDYFDPEERYVLFCRGAGRSALATKRLQEMGYENVAHLEGGFGAWEEVGEIEEVEQRDYKS
ncbi:MAG: rhodanese-like domain-containing protein [Halorientalis sp.]